MRPLALSLCVGLLLVGDTEFEPDVDTAGLPRLVHPSHPLGEPAADHLGQPGLRLRASNGCATGDEGRELTKLPCTLVCRAIRNRRSRGVI
jgi:hypothetical protein